eukprot:scaffold203757_cov21-Tisochrysis_lutea.AAC.1
MFSATAAADACNVYIYWARLSGEGSGLLNLMEVGGVQSLTAFWSLQVAGKPPTCAACKGSSSTQASFRKVYGCSPKFQQLVMANWFQSQLAFTSFG